MAVHTTMNMVAIAASVCEGEANCCNSLGPSVEHSLNLTKILILKQERSSKKKSLAYANESADIMSLFWIIPHRSLETSTPVGTQKVIVYKRLLVFITLWVSA